jgi:hypothetical protein
VTVDLHTILFQQVKNAFLAINHARLVE